jgi:3-deoxy-manno-octulosonate cytidylyltransferase (CMP-KDO synthetase)
MIKVAGIIPARYGSTRFRGKVLADICGKPMIQHVYERSKKASLLCDLIVATDDKRVMNAVQSFGGKAVMTSSAHPSGTDRVAEAAERLDVDVVVNIQADEPLVSSSVIDSVIKPFVKDGSIVMTTLAHSITNQGELHDPNDVKVVLDRNNFALYFSRALIPYPREKDKWFSPENRNRHIWYKHIGMYAYSKAFLLSFAKMKPSPLERVEHLEQLRALERGYRIKVVKTRSRTIGVDTVEDLKRVRIRMLRESRSR